MYIKSVMVDDQAKALAFYTDVLGFRVKRLSGGGGASSEITGRRYSVDGLSRGRCRA